MTRKELLRNRALLGVLARDVVSLTGSQMTLLALPWFVLTTTGSPGRMAVVFAVESASMAVFGFLGGNVATRLGPRRTMLVADACRAPLVALIPLLHALDALSFPLIVAIAAASAAFVTHSFAAKSTLVPEVVGEDERVLSEANALLQGAQRITIFLGPALAGVLIAAIGAVAVIVHRSKVALPPADGGVVGLGVGFLAGVIGGILGAARTLVGASFRMIGPILDDRPIGLAQHAWSAFLVFLAHAGPGIVLGVIGGWLGAALIEPRPAKARLDSTRCRPGRWKGLIRVP